MMYKNIYIIDALIREECAQKMSHLTLSGDEEMEFSILKN